MDDQNEVIGDGPSKDNISYGEGYMKGLLNGQRMERSRISAAAVAEFARWRYGEMPADMDLFVMGAIGSSSNIIGYIHGLAEPPPRPKGAPNQHPSVEGS